MPLLHFLAADVAYCVNVSGVSRIIPLVSLSPSPVDEPYLVGVLNYHGTAVPVIDVNLLKGRAHRECYTRDHSIVVCQGASLFGIVCTEVVDIDDVKRGSDCPEQISPFDCVISNEQVSHKLDIDELFTSLPLPHAHGNVDSW